MHVTYENTVGELIILNLVMVRLVRCFENLFWFFFALDTLTVDQFRHKKYNLLLP